MRTERRSALERLRSTRRRLNRVSRQLQEHCRHFRSVAVVIDHENPHGRDGQTLGLGRDSQGWGYYPSSTLGLIVLVLVVLLLMGRI